MVEELIAGLSLLSAGLLAAWLRARGRAERLSRELAVQQQLSAERERCRSEDRELLEQQFRALAAEMLAESSRQLRSDSGEQLRGVLQPLREQLAGLGRAVADSRADNAARKAQLETVIREMMAQTQQIGQDAVNLTRALKGDTKKQGDWGEMLLESVLEKSGLVKGEHYVTQECVRDAADGNRLYRSDVRVILPQGRSVIIDSKVSLTAYAAYTAAEDEPARQAALKAHVASVCRHMDELARKPYARLVSGALDVVLMFVPNEASYMLALQQEPSLPERAFRQHILLISPTNLVMVLQLIYRFWQSEQQHRNVENIVRVATGLYEKFAGFQETFDSVEKNLTDAVDAYRKARGQLYTGSGNFLKRVESLRHMGVSPQKSLRTEEPAEGDPAAGAGSR